MPDTPEDVYRAAALAWLDAQPPMPLGTRMALMKAQTADAWFRAAVDVAHRAGRTRLVHRVRELANEQFQAGNPWPAGTVLTAQGIRDMLVLLVSEAADE